MNELTAIIQRNLLAIYTMAPAEFIKTYEETINLFQHSSKYALVQLFNDLSVKITEKQVTMNIHEISNLVEDKERLHLMAETLGLAMLLYMTEIEYQKPYDWWKLTTLQLVDLNTPASPTKH